MRLEVETRRFYIGRDYSEAVEGCGGLPVHIPLIPDADYLNELVAGLDGILLPGSDTDPDPYRYGEEPHPRLKKVIVEKDETDLLVLAAAEERNIPVLGICFGMQILNVSRGGTLIQDIGSQIDSPLKHDQGIPLERNSHRIRIEDGSFLAKLAGKGTDGVENVKVNSHHHQAVKVVGRDLKAIASTSDGVIEAVEDTREGRFVIGVQWHPELSWRNDPLFNGIFETFVARCSDT